MEWMASLIENRAFLSLAAVVGASLGVILTRRIVRHGKPFVSERGRQIISAVRNVLAIAATVYIFGLWATEIKTFALSIVAFAAGILIAFKEFFLSFAGAIYLRLSRPFGIGDWMRINQHFGEVADEGFLSVTLLEIDPDAYHYTGRLISVPNYQFLTTSIRNQNFLKKQTFHTFKLTCEPDFNPVEAVEVLMPVLQAELQASKDVNDRYLNMVERRTGIDLPNNEPEIEIRTTEFADIELRIRFFCSRPEAVCIEQLVTKTFFNWYHQNKTILTIR